MSETVIIDKNLFDELVRKEASRQREDDRRGVCSVEEACSILGVNQRKFYRLIYEPKTEIKRSKLRGKYTRRSIERELKRITGEL